MPILPIHMYGRDVLRKKAKPVRQITPEVIELVIDMFETMRNADGIGLAANQVGQLQSVIVIDISGIEEYKDMNPLTLINAKVVEGEGTSTVEEGCLSIPEVRDEVERPERIVVEFMDVDGKKIEMEANGLLARVVQHEIDHVNGILFLDHLSKEKKKLHQPRLKEIRKGEVETEYPVVSAAETAVAD